MPQFVSDFTVTVAFSTLDPLLSDQAAKVYGDTLADLLGGRDKVRAAHDACAPLLSRYNRGDYLSPESRELVDRVERAENAAWAAAKSTWSHLPQAATAEIYFQIEYENAYLHEDGELQVLPDDVRQ